MRMRLREGNRRRRGGGRAAQDDVWEARRAPDGRVYYVNHIEKTTTWDRPGMGGTAAASPPAAAQAAAGTAKGMISAGVLHGMIQRYNQRMVSDYGGGKAMIDAAKGDSLAVTLQIDRYGSIGTTIASTH